jgi:hypothetical protein
VLDFVAKRYGVLPSQVMKLGDSIDMKCANLAVSYESYLNKKQDGGWKDKNDHGYSQEQELHQVLVK